MRNNNNYKYKKRSANWMDKVTYGYSGKPEGDTDVKDHISVKSLRDLPKSSYSFAADPYQAALPTSEPYPILNRFNKVVGGNYDGEDNIDGGNVQQYSNSTTSNFLKSFDILRTKIGVNYRYLPITPRQGTNYVGYQLIDEMRKSISESMSILQSTTYTQMAINNFVVETDLPMGSATTSTLQINNVDHQVYTNKTDTMYAMSIYYQLFLQNALSVMNWHNAFRLKQGTAIRNAWNREVPNLNSFFGLMNKKAFLSMLESINLSFEGEYIDKDFMEQINTLTMVPSRRSNSISDPVLELQISFNKPTTFKVYLVDEAGKYLSTIFDDEDMVLSVMIAGETRTISFWDACDYLKDYLSLEETQLWARQNYNPASITGTDNQRYNTIKSLFDVLVSSFTRFKPAWSDFREAFDIMARTGTISWTKGFRPSITKDTDVDLFWNVMIDHIYQLIYSGAHEISYDNQTKRWRTFSLWNMYSGIPQYDLKSGGSFLTFSFKHFDDQSDEINEQFEYLPLLFDAYSDNGVRCSAVSRDGYVASIAQYETVIQDNIILNRLAPLASQAGLRIRVPTIQYNAGSNNQLTPGHFSNLYKMLTQVFGLCRVQSSANGAYDVALDPDLLAIYSIEISDITNMAITYARSNAPFRGTTSTKGLLGFAKYTL